MNSYFTEPPKPKKKKRTDKERMLCVSVSKKNEYWLDAIEQYSAINNMSKSEYLFALVRQYHLRATGQI